MGKMFAKLRRLAPFYRPYLGMFLFDLFCTLIMVGVELIFPLLVRALMNEGLSAELGLNLEIIIKVSLVILFMRIVDAFADFYVSAYGHIMGAKIENDIRKSLFCHLQKLSFSYYDNVKIGTLMSRMTSDLFDVTEFCHHAPEELFMAVIKITGSFVILSGISLPLTVIIFAFIPPMIFFASKFNRKMHDVFRQRRVQTGEINAELEDSLAGVRVVKSFAGEEIELTKFQKSNRRLLEIKSRAYKYMGTFFASMRFFDGVMYLVCVAAGSFFIMEGKIGVTDLVAYLLYITTLLNSIRRMIEFSEQLQNGMTGFERYLEIVDTDPDIVDSRHAVELKDVRGEIAFEDVSFGYETGERVLEHISFTVKPGEHIALVGPSGGGKTTLCSLIPRFYDCTEGRITVDGKDIREVKLASLRKKIGVVQQEVYLFSGTVAENIAYGNREATMEEIIRAAKLANAHEFISELPAGYDTYCGERGVKLSGGQRQRISIARAFLENPPIIILDEATSALDNESERAVQQSLEQLAKGRTTITIAHRLSTVRGADRIFVVTEEGISESGTHEELIRKKGVYYKLNLMAGELF